MLNLDLKNVIKICTLAIDISQDISALSLNKALKMELEKLKNICNPFTLV